jgi:hypothetical protein
MGIERYASIAVFEVEIAERCLWAWQDHFDKRWVLNDIEKHTESYWHLADLGDWRSNVRF